MLLSIIVFDSNYSLVSKAPEVVRQIIFFGTSGKFQYLYQLVYYQYYMDLVDILGVCSCLNTPQRYHREDYAWLVGLKVNILMFYHSNPHIIA